jgi:hypothetical protein
MIFVEAVKDISMDNIRTTSICYDLHLIKSKYQLERTNHHNTLLDELLNEEKDDESNRWYYLGIIEDKAEEEILSAPKHQQKDQGKEEVISNNNIDDIDDNLNMMNPIDDPEPVVEDIGKEMIEDNLGTEPQGEFVGRVISFGDGNVNLFKDLSQNAFKNNFLKKKREQAKSSKVLKVEKEKKEDRLFEFAETVDKTDVFKKKTKVKLEESKSNVLFKKRKLIKFFHVDQTMYINFY